MWPFPVQRRILGLELPARMAWLLTNDCWNIGDTSRLAHVATFSECDFELELLPNKGSKNKTKAIRRLARNHNAEPRGLRPVARFWQRSARDQSCEVDAEIPDVFRCLIIVVNIGDTQYRSTTVTLNRVLALPLSQKGDAFDID